MDPKTHTNINILSPITKGQRQQGSSNYFSFFSVFPLILFTTTNHNDLAFDNVTSMRQNGENGWWEQQPINHVDDSIECNNVGCH